MEKKKIFYGKRDLNYFAKIIDVKKKEIFENLASLKEAMLDAEKDDFNNESMNFAMHSEQGSDAMEREKTFLFASRDSKFLNHLDDALKRIKKGTYGQCIDCLKLISKKRLEAVPHAQLCVKCKLKKNSSRKSL
ncbi:MAG: TraR/DksA family transcriptional regulator [Bacteroidetes bacterium]|nr:TraR/DksA family transcriptional regulator [Bacteroidota bacterium]